MPDAPIPPPTAAPRSLALTPEELAAIEAASPSCAAHEYDDNAAGTPRAPLDSRLLMSAERAVLGAMIATNGSAPLPIPLAQLLNNAPDSFGDNRHKQIASVIRALKDSGMPVYPQAVIERCEFDDPTAYIADILAQSLSLDLATKEAETIWQAYRERRTTALLAEAFEAVAAAPALTRSVAATVRSELSKLDDESVKDGLPEIIDVSDLASTSPILPPTLMENILHQGSKLSLGGSSKAYKSWTLINIGLSLSTGADWLGFRTTKCRVLYINFEIQPAFMHKRIETLSLARLLFPEPGWFDLWNLRGYSAPHQVIVPKIIKRARDSGYGLIIVDPSYKLFDARSDENSATDVAAIMNSFDAISTQTGASVGFGAHFAKGNASAKEAIDRVSGSGVFARDPDSILTFTKHEEDDCFTLESTLRNLAPVPPFVVKWQYPQFTRQDNLDPARLKSPTGRPPQYDPNELINIIAKIPGGVTTKEWRAEAMSELGISKSSFNNIKRDLIKEKLVFKNNTTGKWIPALSFQKDTPLTTKSPE